MAAGVDHGWLNAADPVVYSELQRELERLEEADPFAVLGVPYEADGAAIRKAFLDRTKVYHPNRFARRDPEIRRLANEVFLRVKKAYSRIESDAGRQRVLDRLGKATGARRRYVDTVPTAIPVTIDGEVGSSPIQSNRRPATGEQPSVNTRVSFQRGERAGQGAPRPRAPASKAEISRRRVSASRRARLREQLAPEPRQRAETAETHPNRLAARVGQEQEQEQEQFKRGRQLIRDGKISEAKETFRQLAVANPTEKTYRIYMHYAWGREHQAAQRDEEARAEYNRALSLDPAFEPARRSIESLPGKKEKGAGLFSKLFRK